MPRCWISIGSNQDRRHSIKGAVQALRARFGEVVLSSVYECEAVGFQGRPFYNLVAGIDSRQPPMRLRQALRMIEDELGRVRRPEKFSPRTLDLDLLTYGDRVEDSEELELPRGEILLYAFVLGPLAEVAGAEVHPVQRRTYGDLWADFAPEQRQLVPVPFDFCRAESIKGP